MFFFLVSIDFPLKQSESCGAPQIDRFLALFGPTEGKGHWAVWSQGWYHEHQWPAVLLCEVAGLVQCWIFLKRFCQVMFCSFESIAFDGLEPHFSYSDRQHKHHFQTSPCNSDPVKPILTLCRWQWTSPLLGASQCTRHWAFHVREFLGIPSGELT